MTSSSSNKQIAKNAMMLYLRMFVIMAISFYTSRIVLQALGVSDYGVYNVVCGFVVMVGILNSALSNSTSRFLTYGIGLNDAENLKRTFSAAFFVHLFLTLIFLVFAETIGLWFVNNQLVIPADRLGAANWAYQSAIFSTAIGITQVPYNSLITSHERFNVFAIIEIVNAVLKLCIALLVLYSSFDNLKFYSVLYAAVAVLIMIFYRVYCIRNFKETKITWRFDKGLTKSILKFSCWNLISQSSSTLYHQGQNILINRFYGTLINAAAGIAFQVQAILYSFIGNISTAFNPQIIKEYAQKNYSRVNDLIMMGGTLSSLFCMIITIPVYIKLDYLLSLWLHEVPEGTMLICRILLIANLINSFNPFPFTAINATGKNKTVSVACTIITLLQLPLIYFMLKTTDHYLYAYVSSILMPLMSCCVYVLILKRYMIEFNIYRYLIRLILPSFAIGFITLFILGHVNNIVMSDSFSFILVIIVSSILVFFSYYTLIFNAETKLYLKKRLHIIREK